MTLLNGGQTFITFKPNSIINFKAKFLAFYFFLIQNLTFNEFFIKLDEYFNRTSTIISVNYPLNTVFCDFFFF